MNTKINCFISGILILLAGCASMQFRNDLSQYQDRVWDKSQPEFLRILEYLIQHHSVAREKLLGNEPEVLAVVSSYYRRGFSVITFEKMIGNGHVFCSDGSGFDVGHLNGSGFDIGLLHSGHKNLEREGVERQREFNDKRRAEELKKRHAEEEYAINHPRKIYLEELIGIKANTEIANKMQDAGIWPHFEYSNGKLYRRYKEGTIPGLKPIADEFHIDGIDCKKDGLFSAVHMWAQVNSISDVGEFITSLLHTIQAKLHTPKQAELEYSYASKKYSYVWNDFELADGRRIHISVSKTLYEAYASVYCYIADVTEEFERRKKEMAERQMERARESAKKVKDNAAQVLCEGPMLELFNRIKRNLVIIKTDKCVGSGFVANDGGNVYLYTNEHVVRGSVKPVATDIEGRAIEIGDFELAKGRDVVRFKVSSSLLGLSLASQGIEIDNDIAVFGNSDGADVITALGGKIIGVGPSLIEISAEFVQGNSGSPVLTLDGKVVGIATFAVNGAESENWVKSGTRFDGVRRFALRLDNIQWEAIDWELYHNIINR